MMIKTVTHSLIIMLLIFSSCSQSDSDVISPDGNLQVNVEITAEQQVVYSVFLNGQEVISPSRLGIIREDGDFSEELVLTSVSRDQKVEDHYTMMHGKQLSYNYEANKKIFRFTNSQGQPMDVIFQVSNDGVAFRYSFPGSGSDIKKITNEITAFNLPENTTAWIQPRAKAKTGWESTNPSYEEDYLVDVAVDNLQATETGWVFPALFNHQNHWILLSETAPDRDYCGTRLMKGDNNGFVIGFPEEVEYFNNGPVFPQSTLPWQTPWRIIAVGDLATITASTLGTDLAHPQVLDDVYYVKPGRSSWSWVMLKDDSIVYNVQKRFIDYSADMGWEYCLIDVNWDTMIGYDRIRELAQYADERNVGLILWYNSAGDWNTTPYQPRDKMLTPESRNAEFSRISEMGIKGIKVDFFPGDGQSSMAYYQDIFEDAHKYQLLVNCHGTTLPRGWQRTYPNLVTMESIKGFEFVTFTQENANLQPTISTIAPFTRNVFDPMDFTPMGFSELTGINRVTSNGFELATAVIFLSGVQHYAETDIGMAIVPQYVKDMARGIPVAWDESRLIDGYPGKLVIMARRIGNTWYIAGINGEQVEKDVHISLPFIDAQKGMIITDGVDNRTFTMQEVEPGASKDLTIKMMPYGGFVIKF